MMDLLTQYSKFLKLKGHRVVQTPSGFWIDVRPLVFQITPPFNLNPHLGQEAHYVFKEVIALVCRYFTINHLMEDVKQGKGPFLYILRPPYDFSYLHQKARNQTRRGLERVEVRREYLDKRIEQLAYEVYRDNIKRLGLMKTEKQIQLRWQLWVHAIRNASCVEFWGAWKNQDLVAFSVIVWTPWGVEIVLQRSLTSALKLYPNNALVYIIAQDVFKRGASLLSFGLSSFAGIANGLHHFKINMGFKAFPLIEYYCWHPILRPFTPLLEPNFLRRVYQIFMKITQKK